MMRIKPTRLEIEQVDIEALDTIRIQSREKASRRGETSNVLTEQGSREKAVSGLTARERIGIPTLKPSQH